MWYMIYHLHHQHQSHKLQAALVSMDAGDVSSPSLTVSTPVREETENTEVRDESTPIGFVHVNTPCSDANVDTQVKGPVYVLDTPEVRSIGKELPLFSLVLNN